MELVFLFLFVEPTFFAPSQGVSGIQAFESGRWYRAEFYGTGNSQPAASNCQSAFVDSIIVIVFILDPIGIEGYTV